ncbi:unnamed protein product [Chondrus crispus]|uniref:Uncharacterized protein n=1 Tax=Chondrus crispus TaxID=2769 RepID=R7QQD5_CHOCR|nr:unnamed protein product [Chondrus crispus]CDF40712.1 unnamed protein product [Chondrus crispus]|eukprot:XP_005711006.1 unnamed protein product [Chondrus crispus]
MREIKIEQRRTTVVFALPGVFDDARLSLRPVITLDAVSKDVEVSLYGKIVSPERLLQYPGRHEPQQGLSQKYSRSALQLPQEELLPRFRRDGLCVRPALSLVLCKRLEVPIGPVPVRGELRREDKGVFGSQACALRHVRRDNVRGVADECDARRAPAGERAPVFDGVHVEGVVGRRVVQRLERLGPWAGVELCARARHLRGRHLHPPVGLRTVRAHVAERGAQAGAVVDAHGAVGGGVREERGDAGMNAPGGEVQHAAVAHLAAEGDGVGCGVGGWHVPAEARARAVGGDDDARLKRGLARDGGGVVVVGHAEGGSGRVVVLVLGDADDVRAVHDDAQRDQAVQLAHEPLARHEDEALAGSVRDGVHVEGLEHGGDGRGGVGGFNAPRGGELHVT